jgi:hypothetical protein
MAENTKNQKWAKQFPATLSLSTRLFSKNPAIPSPAPPEQFQRPPVLLLSVHSLMFGPLFLFSAQVLCSRFTVRRFRINVRRK